MSRIENKLPLPFPFYDDINKQNRYKTQCEGWQHGEYVIVPGCRLLPFQIRGRFEDPTLTTADFNMFLINVEDESETEITAFLTLADWDLTTAGSNDYITYYARNDIEDTGNCVFTDNCVYYLKITDDNDSIGTWYSELFIVKNADATPADTKRILWSAGTLNKLKHDSAADDLLIYDQAAPTT